MRLSRSPDPEPTEKPMSRAQKKNIRKKQKKKEKKASEVAFEIEEVTTGVEEVTLSDKSSSKPDTKTKEQERVSSFFLHIHTSLNWFFATKLLLEDPK